MSYSNNDDNQKSTESVRIELNVDTVGYKDKESAKKATGAICNRTKCSNGIVTINPAQLVEVIECGKTFTPGVLTGTTEAAWKSQQIIAADIDNKKDLLDGSGNRVKDNNKVVQVPCTPIVTPEKALEILHANNLDPYLMYYSFSNTPELPKFRIIFVLSEKLTDGAESKKLTRKLAYLFNSATKEPNADMSIATLDRLLYGSTPGSVFYKSEHLTDKSQFDGLIDPESVKEDLPKNQCFNDYWKDINEQERERLKKDVENFDLSKYILRTRPGSRIHTKGRQNYINPCPVCGHNDDFCVNGAFWVCYSSATDRDTNGSIIDYLIEAEHMTLPDALDYFKHDIMNYPRHEKPVQETNTTKQFPNKNAIISKLRRLSTYEQKEIEWLIPGYIPKGCITLLCSDGGVGKGGVWTGIAAGISNGKIPEFFGIPFDDLLGADNKLVVYASTEDSTEHVIKGRIINNGGCDDNIINIPLEEKEFEDLTFDSKVLETIISEVRPAICIFDPIQSFVGKDVHMSERNAMRKTLEPLLPLGEKYGTSFLIVVHCNKGRGNYGNKRVADSADIWDIARSVLMCGFTENKQIRYMSHEKCNYGDLSDTILFSFENGRIVNKGHTEKRDREFQTEMQFVRATPAKDEAEDFILETLKHGPMIVNTLNENAAAAGISNYSLRTAKESLKKDGRIKIYTRSEGPGRTKQYISLCNDTRPSS